MSETYTGGGNTLVWDCYTCPNCQSETPMGIMSVIARCGCGWVYIQDGLDNTGWFESLAAYHGGAKPSTRTSHPDPQPASIQTQKEEKL